MGDTNLDAWSAIEEIDSYMEAPEADMVFVSAPLAITFNGADSEDPSFAMNYAFVGSGGNAFTDDTCAPYDHALWTVGDMYTDAEAEALMCVSVPKDQADGGVWRVHYIDLEYHVEETEAFYSTS